MYGRMDDERQRDRWRWDEDGRPGYGGPGELGRGDDEFPRSSYGAYIASGRGGGSAGLPRREPWQPGDDDVPSYGAYGYGPMDHEIGRGQGFAPSQWAGYRGRGQRQELLTDAGPYRGMGPRGYRRSDDRIRDDVCDLLTDSGRLDASDIDVRVREGVVTLTGSVADRASKRSAEDLAERCRGVTDVRNELSIAGFPGSPVMDERARSSVGSSAGTGGTGPTATDARTPVGTQSGQGQGS